MENEKNLIASATTFLEKEYKINYDQSTGKAAGSVFNMSFSNHHMKSIAHAPDLVGLLFYIVGQFRGTSHFLDNGRLITYDTELQELRGGISSPSFIVELSIG